MSTRLFRMLVLAATICRFAPAVQSQNITLHFQPVFYGKSIALEQGPAGNNGDSLSIHTLRFYLGHFAFYKNGKEVWQEKDSYHLLDMEDKNTMAIVFKSGAVDDFDQINFLIGTDSLTNVSGALGGDLDPTKGMYWAWNSGYINFKIEGFSENCPAPGNLFQFHIGGYLPPYQTAQAVVLPVSEKNMIRVDVELSRFFENIDWKDAHNVMSPGAEAARLAKTLPALFHIHAE
ncbi:MAG: hypothetical protein H6565_07505 [Lewinellaceae bacterium]|nr:hypothetical protein [Lewinellaceae bacterium]